MVKTIFYWIGLENDNHELLQPVLEYINGGWVIQSWYVIAGVGYSSPAVVVHPGDLIYGQLKLLDYQGGFGYWGVYTSDVTTGQSTTGGFTTSSVPFPYADGAVLEVYDLSACNQYPSSNDFYTYNYHISQAGPAWNSWNVVTPQFYASILPHELNCGYNVTVAPGSVRTDLYWTH